MKNMYPILENCKKLWLILLLLITFTSNAAPLDRRPKGRGTYDEPLKNRDFPFTFILPDTSDPVEFINVVKHGIQTDTAKKFLLSFIFERYNDISSAGFNREVVYQKSLKAKLAAFIYMVGLKYNSTSQQVETLPAFGLPEREQYATVA